jgi:hypothetical protein
MLEIGTRRFEDFLKPFVQHLFSVDEKNIWADFLGNLDLNNTNLQKKSSNFKMG